MLDKIKAKANIRGNKKNPDIKGKVLLYQTKRGVIVAAEVKGLPKGTECKEPIFAFHIHEGGSCTGNNSDLFADAKAHYNPNGCDHPYHAGDMPSLFGNNGYALLIFITDRFTVEEIIGKTIIIHNKQDDFTNQPSGNPGEKIACGEIKRY